MLRKIIIGQADKLSHYITLFIPIVIFIILGYILISYCENNKLNNKHMKLKIIILVGIDQITKLMVHYLLVDGVINIPGNLYLLKGVKNEHVNALFNIMDISLPPWITTMARVLVLVIFILVVANYEKKHKKDSYLDFAKIFIYAMIISSIIDSSLWGYTLDFIVSRNLQAVDLKDIYGSIGIGSLVIYGIKIEVYSKKLQNK